MDKGKSGDKAKLRVLRFLKNGPAAVRDATASGKLLIDGGRRGTISAEGSTLAQLAAAGLVFSGTHPELGLVEFVELPRGVHPYYISTQAHPELRSRPTRPHPLFAGLIGAAIARQRELRFPIDETGLRRREADEPAVVARASD